MAIANLSNWFGNCEIGSTLLTDLRSVKGIDRRRARNMYRGRAGPGRTPCRAARHRGPQEASPAPSSRSSHQQARLVVRHRLTGSRQQRSQRWSQPTRPACSRPSGGRRRRRPETPPEKTRRTWPRRSIGPQWAQPASPSARRSSERRSTTRTTTCPGPAVVASSATRAPACPAPPWQPRIAVRSPKPRRWR